MTPWLCLTAAIAAVLWATLSLIKASVLLVESAEARAAVCWLFLAVAGFGLAYYGISFLIVSWVDESLDR